MNCSVYLVTQEVELIVAFWKGEKNVQSDSDLLLFLRKTSCGCPLGCYFTYVVICDSEKKKGETFIYWNLHYPPCSLKFHVVALESDSYH